MPLPHPTTGQALRHALRLSCPRCGGARVFKGWYGDKPACEECQLPFERRAGDTWGFVYLTNAAFVGPLVVALLILKAYGAWYSHWVTAAILAGLILLTLPYRKALAIAVDYLVGRGEE